MRRVALLHHFVQEALDNIELRLQAALWQVHCSKKLHALWALFKGAGKDGLLHAFWQQRAQLQIVAQDLANRKMKMSLTGSTAEVNSGSTGGSIAIIMCHCM